MRLSVDKQNDTLSFRPDEENIIESEKVASAVILDFDEDNRVIGIEISDASKRMGAEQLSPSIRNNLTVATAVSLAH